MMRPSTGNLPQILVCLVLLASGLFSPAAVSQENDFRYAQLWLGKQQLDSAWSITDDEGSAYLADLDALRRIGFSFQTPHSRGPFEYGWDFSGTLGYENNPRFFVRVGSEGASGNIRIDSRLWLGDVTFGGFISSRPVNWLRLYLSAGPGIYWGHLQHNGNSASRGSAIVIDTRTSDNDLGFMLYARAGAELVLTNGLTFGLSARHTDTRFDFGNSGKIDLAEPQIFLTLGNTF